jgi:conserved domain protein
MVFIMKIKDLIKQSYEDLKNLTINWFNILMLVVIVFVLSNIITPIVGIPVGLLGGAYFLKRREEKEDQ